MPSMDDIYVDVAGERAGWPAPRPVAKHEPVPVEVQTTALVRFSADIGVDLKADALAMLDRKIAAPETAEQALTLANDRAKVKTLLKDIEDRRKRIVEPIKRDAAAVDAEAKRWSDGVRAWDRKAETVLLAYQKLDAHRKLKAQEELDKQAADAAAAQTRAEEAGDAAAADAASVALMKAEAAPVEAPVRGFKTDAGTTTLRTVWRVEVIDAEQVPDVYLVPDLRKLQAAVNAGAREIAGCNVFEHESLPVRTR